SSWTYSRPCTSTMTPAKSSLRIFTADDANPSDLHGLRAAVLGYGNLGRPFALNLHDSGVDVVVGNIDDVHAERARDDGFDVLPLSRATAQADVALLLLPDELIPELYAAEIGPHLQPGSAIVFASGYPLAFDLIRPAESIDVLLLAPRMSGEEIRRGYATG